MLRVLKNSCIALAAVTAIALPINSASAQEPVVIGRAADGVLYEIQPGGPTMSLEEAKASATPMAIRNDENPDSPLSIPEEYMPPAGMCRLWYPGAAEPAQPEDSDCGVVVPRGAVMLIG